MDRFAVPGSCLSASESTLQSRPSRVAFAVFHFSAYVILTGSKVFTESGSRRMCRITLNER